MSTLKDFLNNVLPLYIKFFANAAVAKYLDIFNKYLNEALGYSSNEGESRIDKLLKLYDINSKDFLRDFLSLVSFYQYVWRLENEDFFESLAFDFKFLFPFIRKFAGTRLGLKLMDAVGQVSPDFPLYFLFEQLEAYYPIIGDKKRNGNDNIKVGDNIFVGKPTINLWWSDDGLKYQKSNFYRFTSYGELRVYDGDNVTVRTRFPPVRFSPLVADFIFNFFKRRFLPFYAMIVDVKILDSWAVILERSIMLFSVSIVYKILLTRKLQINYLFKNVLILFSRTILAIACKSGVSKVRFVQVLSFRELFDYGNEYTRYFSFKINCVSGLAFLVPGYISVSEWFGWRLFYVFAFGHFIKIGSFFILYKNNLVLYENFTYDIQSG